ncbi:MAG: hypothetical protein DBX47_07725 [Clostridiales bacterium]|nr:MAG: hypothetical protein DBX47_07725 [Clostridiales bacterium]
MFERISKGSSANAEDYAQLVKEITKGTVEFNKNEVFSLSENFAAFYEKIADGFDDFGVQDIKIVEEIFGKRDLCIEYIAIYGYSVRILNEDERLFYGEHPDVREEPADLMGKYRVEISFYDSEAASELIKKYGGNKIHEFEEVPESSKSKFKIRMGNPDDSTFIIYIGSDEPIKIKEQDYIKVNYPMGSIKIPIEK